jgi:small basic protein
VLLPLAGLIIGALLALALSVRVDTEMARYTGVVILVGLASILGAIRAELESEYDSRVFVGGFVVNAAAAVLMVYIGDRLGLELYLVVSIVFGLSIFGSISLIRRHFIGVRSMPAVPMARLDRDTDQGR